MESLIICETARVFVPFYTLLYSKQSCRVQFSSAINPSIMRLRFPRSSSVKKQNTAVSQQQQQQKPNQIIEDIIMEQPLLTDSDKGKSCEQQFALLCLPQQQEQKQDEWTSVTDSITTFGDFPFASPLGRPWPTEEEGAEKGNQRRQDSIDEGENEDAEERNYEEEDNGSSCAVGENMEAEVLDVEDSHETDSERHEISQLWQEQQEITKQWETLCMGLHEKQGDDNGNGKEATSVVVQAVPEQGVCAIEETSQPMASPSVEEGAEKQSIPEDSPQVALEKALPSSSNSSCCTLEGSVHPDDAVLASIESLTQNQNENTQKLVSIALQAVARAQAAEKERENMEFRVRELEGYIESRRRRRHKRRSSTHSLPKLSESTPTVTKEGEEQQQQPETTASCDDYLERQPTDECPPGFSGFVEVRQTVIDICELQVQASSTPQDDDVVPEGGLVRFMM